MSIEERIISGKDGGRKAFAVLLDPDNVNVEVCLKLIHEGIACKIDYFFVGGSLLVHNENLSLVLNTIRSVANIPIVLFPGSYLQVNPLADAILLLSLISGRNPEFLIGHHVTAAPLLKQSKLEILPTGYILVDCGVPTTVSYISNTTPIPYDKPAIAACTAMAGAMLGLKYIFLDGGSGAAKTISTIMVKEVAAQIDIPLIVGGGINDAQKAKDLLLAGADIIVVGNGIEKRPSLLSEIAEVVRDLNSKIEKTSKSF